MGLSETVKNPFSTLFRLLPPAVSQSPHILLSQIYSEELCSFLSQLPVPPSIICHLPDETSLLLLLLCTFTPIFLPTFFLLCPLFHFSPLFFFLLALSRPFLHTQQGFENVIFPFSLCYLFSLYFFLTLFFLTCNVLGLMPRKPRLREN